MERTRRGRISILDKPIYQFRARSRTALSLSAIGAIACFSAWAWGQGKPTTTYTAAGLGRRLFNDERFSTPKGDLPASCNHCHLFDEDPQGMRAHADFLSRSWVSYRLDDPRREELRNSPTLFDVSKMPRLHFDGEFTSLEDLVKGTLAGRPMGWLPSEKKEGLERIYSVAVADTGDAARPGSSYRDQFKQVYGVDIQNLPHDQVVDWVARAVADYMRTLNSDRTTPFDRFAAMNGLEPEPAKGEDAKAFGERLLGRLSTLEGEGKLKYPKGFDSTALAGMKIFLRVEGSGSVGNCVACHVPPLFTDLSFHNMGVSQIEYDKLHGEGSFAALEIPKADADRPIAQLREAPSRRKPGDVDLGHWNFVSLKSSPLRRPGEPDDQFLNRMIGTFKTPTLRHLRFTAPYMHNGAFSTLRDALSEIITMSEMARAGKIREADDDLARIRIGESDIAPLIAFLNSLNQDLIRKREPSK